jgi:hypothetical protein
MCRQAVAIVPNEYADTSGRTLVTDAQAIIDVSPGHVFTGRFDCEGEENADMWRLVIRNGRAVRIDAQIVWPDDNAVSEI